MTKGWSWTLDNSRWHYWRGDGERSVCGCSLPTEDSPLYATVPIVGRMAGLDIRAKQCRKCLKAETADKERNNNG